MDAKWELLSSSSSSHEDARKEGIRVNMNGGFFGTGKEKRSQKAIVEFLCDKSRTGLENLWTPEEDDRYDEGKDKRKEKHDKEDDDDDEDAGADDKTPSRIFQQDNAKIHVSNATKE